jgi:uncharacterized protein (TIGR02996 family)
MAKAKAKPKAKQPQVLRLVDQAGFWEITRTGNSITTSAGQHHSQTKQKTFKLSTPEKAQAKWDELVAKQRATGMALHGETPAPTVPIVRDEALEAAIRENRADPAPYLVYADWLQGQGSPLGELLVLAQRKKSKAADAIAKQIGRPQAGVVEVEWRFGVWRSLYINNVIDWDGTSLDPMLLARGLFGSPLCMALEELRIGMVRWDYNDQPDLIAEAGKHGWAKDLARLTVGDIADDIDMDHHSIGDVGKAITKAFPNLQSLKLHSGSQSWRGSKETFGVAGFDLPKLKELVVETCAMSSKRMKALTAAKLPQLEKLELWFGERERDANAKAGDVAPVWDGKTFPKLKHLGLRNSELVTDFVRVVPASKLAKQLEVLDFSMGTMNDADADELAAEAKQFPKLKQLIVDDSFLTDAAVKRLKAAFKGVQVSAKEMKERYDDEEDARYVSVSE